MNDIIKRSITEDFSNLISDNAEAAFDLIVDDGVLKDLPVIGSAVSLFKIGKTIADKHYLTNLLHFIYQLRDIPIEKKQKMIEQIELNTNQRIKVGNFLTSILIKTETTQKADFLGYIFGQYVEGNITHDIFLKLSYSIGNIFWEDIVAFSKIKDLNRDNNSLLIDTFISHGFMTSYEIGARIGNSGGPINAKINEFGEKLRDMYNSYKFKITHDI